MSDAREASIRRALEDGMRHHDAGRLGEAEAAYQAVLREHPGQPDALALLGDVASRSGRLDEAVALLREALRHRPGVAQLHQRMGMLLAQRGDLDAAIGAYRTALRAKPDYAEAWFQLGNAMLLAGRAGEAIPAYRRAVASAPRLAAAHNNLGQALEAEERSDEALVAYRAALALDDHARIRANVARCLAAMPLMPADGGMRALVARALEEAWIRPADLARVAVGLLRAHPAIGAAIDRACREWPARGAPSALLTPALLEAARDERLLAALLENAHASDRDLERGLACMRHALLEAVDDGSAADAALPLACALARQCFLNDRVWPATAGEDARAEALAGRVRAALERGALPEALPLAILAAYVPLASLPGAERLLEGAWPPCLREVVVQQVAQPAAEARELASIAAVTPIRDPVSRDVRRQYEESPYPRWTRLPALPPVPLEAWLRALFPHARLPRDVPDRDILVAGCGTGQESLDLARQFPASRILAVDLSRASLGYAARKAREAGCANVEHAQADITELAALRRSFDVISCVGVLHHLAEPLAGWRALRECLRPGGFMQVGLYSATARTAITEARAHIAARGFVPTPDGIRRCREEMLGDARWQAIARLRDFYGMNECRDLLFHVQEHCTTLPAIGSTLDALGLELVGLAVAPAVARRFARRFPGAGPGDLAAWHAFEAENPETFAGMYLFWVRKPA